MRPSDCSPAEIALDIAVGLGPDGRSRLTGRRVRYPWSLGRGFPAETASSAVTIIPQAAAAGLLPGDRHRQRLRVAEGAVAHLVSAGATMVYGSRAPACVLSRTHWQFEIGCGAGLVHVAEPYVINGPGALDARQVVRLSPGARFVGCEGIVPDPAGEGRFSSHFIVETDSGTLLHDTQEADAEALRRHSAFDPPWRAFASIYALAPKAQHNALTEAQPFGPASCGEGVVAAAALLRGDLGLGVRIAARDGGLMRNACRTICARLVEALELG
ncbi:MAG: urease accessory protein UreD [Pseudomonadota bacterium]